MIAFAQWFTPDVLRALGASLLHFLWQGAALAVLAAVGVAIARRASTRYAIGVAALALMVAAPVVTFSLLLQPDRPIDLPQAANVPMFAHTANLASQHLAAVTPGGFSSGSLPTAFVEIWFIGVLLFSLRTAGGFFLVARLRRRESHPVQSDWLALCREIQQRLGITRAIRYCESLHLDAPAVIGWFRPVVLLPVSALTGLTDLQLRASSPTSSRISAASMLS